MLVIAHMYEPSLLNAIYPISVFGYALLQNPRSLPRIGGSLIHPMIQNPPRHFWHFLLGYSFLVRACVRACVRKAYICMHMHVSVRLRDTTNPSDPLHTHTRTHDRCW